MEPGDGLQDAGQRGNEVVTSAAFTLKLCWTLGTGAWKQMSFSNSEMCFLLDVDERDGLCLQVRGSMPSADTGARLCSSPGPRVLHTCTGLK